MEVWLGIDARGSNSVLLCVDQNLQIICKDEGGAIHARMMKIEDQVAGVRTLLDKALLRVAHASVRGLCVGVAGAGRETEQSLLRTELEKIYPDFPIMVTSDAHIAHAEAFHNGDGILIITGTGSMVLGKKDNRWDRAGGFGFLIGDPAGSYRLGQESLFAICTAMDGGKGTMMEGLLKDRFAISTREELILNIYGNSIQPAQIAPVLLSAAELGDDIAQHIISDNCTKLASQVAVAAETLAYETTPICVIGSLFQNEYFREVLTSCLNDAIRDIEWIPEVAEPALGACRLIVEKTRPIAVP